MGLPEGNRNGNTDRAEHLRDYVVYTYLITYYSFIISTTQRRSQGVCFVYCYSKQRSNKWCRRVCNLVCKAAITITFSATVVPAINQVIEDTVPSVNREGAS